MKVWLPLRGSREAGGGGRRGEESQLHTIALLGNSHERDDKRRCSVYFIERAMRICHLGDFTHGGSAASALMSARVCLLASACLPARAGLQRQRHFMQEMSPVNGESSMCSILLRSSSSSYFCRCTSKPTMRAC